MGRSDDTHSLEAFIRHFGVKGMKWGVRRRSASSKTERPNHTVLPKGVTVRKDGSISVEKGASLQRLVRSNGSSAPLKNLTFASMLEYDNARYVKVIGGKGPFGGGRDQILGLTATKPIRTPTHDQATRMVSDMMLNDPKFRAKNQLIPGVSISAKELEQIRADPGGKTAQAWYLHTNTKLTIDPRDDPDVAVVQKMLKEKVASKGYNALRDENDFETGLAKAPVIVFSPEKSLKVTTVTTITDDLRKANKQTLASYKKQGKDWLDTALQDSA